MVGITNMQQSTDPSNSGQAGTNPTGQEGNFSNNESNINMNMNSNEVNLQPNGGLSMNQ